MIATMLSVLSRRRMDQLLFFILALMVLVNSMTWILDIFHQIKLNFKRCYSRRQKRKRVSSSYARRVTIHKMKNRIGAYKKDY